MEEIFEDGRLQQSDIGSGGSLIVAAVENRAKEVIRRGKNSRNTPPRHTTPRNVSEPTASLLLKY